MYVMLMTLFSIISMSLKPAPYLTQLLQKYLKAVFLFLKRKLETPYQVDHMPLQRGCYLLLSLRTAT